VLDVGNPGQIRAGRDLTLVDFTALGLNAPQGLWNLSDLSDVSGNGRTLTNKGAVTFGAGVGGAAGTAAVFNAAVAQALYISDTGAGDPFRTLTGSIGCWFRTAKRAAQTIMGRLFAAGPLHWMIQTNTSAITVNASADGTSWGGVGVGTTDVCDDRWHFVTVVVDGTVMRVYIDALLEFAVSLPGPLANVAAPLNIGAYGADAVTAPTYQHFGRVDEAFITSDVLSDDQIRCLYAAKVAHPLGAVPSAAVIAVHRLRRGAGPSPGSFTTTPLRLHQLNNGAGNDTGSQGVPLVNNGGAVPVAGADGQLLGAFNFSGAQSLSSTDAGLPAALTSRSYGCWVQDDPRGNRRADLVGRDVGAAAHRRQRVA
jgi:hypothetical protein